MCKRAQAAASPSVLFARTPSTYTTPSATSASSAAGPVGDTVSVTATGGGAQVSWMSVSGAVSYNTYRGTVSNPALSYNHVCFEVGDQLADGATLTTDAALPPSGTAQYYLVSTVDGCGESTLGRSTGGVERLPASACP